MGRQDRLGNEPSASEPSREPEEGTQAAAPAAEPAHSGPHSYPVFYDERRRRWPWLRSGLLTAMALVGVGLVLLTVSIFARALMPRTTLPRVAPERDFSNMEPLLKEYQIRKLGYKQAQDQKRLLLLEEKAEHDAAERRTQAAAFVKQTGHAVPDNPGRPVVAGFYVNWEQTSNASVHRNIKYLTHFIPEWLHLKSAGANFADPSPNDGPFLDDRQKQDRDDVMPLVRSHKVPIIPLLNNYTRPKSAEEGQGAWDPAAVHQVVSNPAARLNVITRLRDWLVREQMQGINIDFEEVDPADGVDLVKFMRELYGVLHPLGLLVTEDVPADNDNFDVASLARVNDWVVPMFYDEHAGGEPAGPVAGVDWTRQNLQRLLTNVPAGKIVMGVGNHGYDWDVNDPSHSADNTTYQSAVVVAKESQPDAVIHLDPKSLNPTFSYSDTRVDAAGRQQDEEHTVWMEDAVSVFNQLQVAKPQHIRGSALWFLGSEDPSLWTFFNKDAWNTDWKTLVTNGTLDTVRYGGQGLVVFEGDGELLQPETAPSDGRRSLVLDPTTGLITAETYAADPQTGTPLLPSSWVVRRYGGGGDGNAEKKVVLTFDDGPDPRWTPQILDILKRYHVPACFFVVGKEAEANPQIVRREWDEGHEIGNHSWSHPDLFRLSQERQDIELNMTERVIQAITGHSTTLFRPPFGGDTEPQTGKEVSPMLEAAHLNYITVGERNDPQDWRIFNLKPGTQVADTTSLRDFNDIVNSVVVNRNVGSVILLHDAGGDRSRTLDALPRIIEQLRAMGYTFTTVADLRGLPREKLMPPVSGKDTLLVGADRYIFQTAYIVQVTLATLFTLSIVLGVSRVTLFVLLALFQYARERKRVFPVGFMPSVSVVIAAYNEEKVIANTIEALLRNDYPNLEIIVVDDGSKDRTSEVVREMFAAEPRVHLVRKENGGKASALNLGLESATGDIMISLDADTLFATNTITRLVRHFADPKVGAVSGNVRVGNTHNIWTRWQALEYTTSQNFDRRGYDLLNCITVVPGAVGAMRRAAIFAVGGYTSDTLAEDTDLTWKLRRAEWRIVNDNTAMAYTEAPETLRNLAKQRFRWAFGTLQCLWKHRSALWQHGAFGWIALPSLWVYQILFPAISPFMDIAMIYSIFAGNFAQFAAYFLWMLAIEVTGAVIAFIMDRGDWTLLPWLVLQRFVYRQLMYYVILKSLLAAARGGAVGWNKFERTGTARIETKTAG